jgi:hypothetical protein
MGPLWDHTLYAIVNDLRLCARYARIRRGQPLAVTGGKSTTAIYWGSSGLNGYGRMLAAVCAAAVTVAK